MRFNHLQVMPTDNMSPFKTDINYADQQQQPDVCETDNMTSSRTSPTTKDPWNDKFEELERYKSEHGHLNVPYQNNRKLYHWVYGNRRRFQKLMKDKNVSLPPDIQKRFDALQRLGLFDVVSPEKQSNATNDCNGGPNNYRQKMMQQNMILSFNEEKFTDEIQENNHNGLSRVEAVVAENKRPLKSGGNNGNQKQQYDICGSIGITSPTPHNNINI